MITTSEYSIIKRYFKLQDISMEESEDRAHDLVIKILEGDITEKLADIVQRYALSSPRLALISILNPMSYPRYA